MIREPLGNAQRGGGVFVAGGGVGFQKELDVNQFVAAEVTVLPTGRGLAVTTPKSPGRWVAAVVGEGGVFRPDAGINDANDDAVSLRFPINSSLLFLNGVGVGWGRCAGGTQLVLQSFE